MKDFWPQLVITVASSSLFVALLQALLGRFRISRRSEQLAAWQNELEVLNQIDRTTGSGAALHIAARQGVYRSIANRLVPPTFWQAFGFFIAGLLAATLSVTLFWIVESAGLPWEIGRIGLASLYSFLAFLAFAMCFMRPRASEKLRAAVLAGIEAGENSSPGAKQRFQASKRELLREQNEQRWDEVFDYIPSETNKTCKQARKNSNRLSEPYKFLIRHAVEPTVRDGVFNFLRDLHQQVGDPSKSTVSESGYV